jgi:hypothetical protein
MECPHCDKHISSHKTHCNYCGGKIERSFIRKFRDFFSNENIDEEKFIQSLANGRPPVIKSRRELELYVKYRVQDEEAAVVTSEALERTGNEGVVEIKRGGDGKPYKVECISNKLPSNILSKEVKNRKEQLLQRMRNKNDLTKNERQNIQSELAQLVDYHVIIWINSFLSKEEFDAKEQLIMNALEAATEGITGRIEPRNSNE